MGLGPEARPGAVQARRSEEATVKRQLTAIGLSEGTVSERPPPFSAEYAWTGSWLSSLSGSSAFPPDSHV